MLERPSLEVPLRALGHAGTSDPGDGVGSRSAGHDIGWRAVGVRLLGDSTSWARDSRPGSAGQAAMEDIMQRNRDVNALRRRCLLTASVVALLGVSACGEDAPLSTPRAEVRGGAIGPDASVNDDVKLLQVQLEYPLDGVYDVGEDARLFFGLANTGTTPAELVDVTGPDFADASMGDGQTVALTVEPNDNVYVGAEGMPVIVLEDLKTELRSSESIPITFSFAQVGHVTIDAMVAAERQDPVPTYDFPDPAEDPTPEEG